MLISVLAWNFFYKVGKGVNLKNNNFLLVYRAMGSRFIVIWTLQDLFTKLQTTYLYIRRIVLTEEGSGTTLRGGRGERDPLREKKTSHTDMFTLFSFSFTSSQTILT